jgi:predicted Zn-dependent protease
MVQGVLFLVPLDSDIELGYEAWDSLRYKTVQDVWGVERIGHEMAAMSASDIPWSFGVVHASQVNAFALPGGIVRVTDALLKQLNLSNAELAALLGHEMGHVIHRHAQARLLHQQLLSLILQALVYEDYDDHQESFGEALGELLLRRASFLGQQSFSRKNEYQADATAWQLLLESKRYSPLAVQGLLEKLWDYTGGSGDTSWESTHPGTKDRIEALQVQWKDMPRLERQRLARLQQ